MNHENRKKYAAFTILLNAVPGLGYLLAGCPGRALLWFAAVLAGYSLYLLPGLFLHAWSTWSLVKYWHQELERRPKPEQPRWIHCERCDIWAESLGGGSSPYCEHCGARMAEPEVMPPALTKAA